MLALLGSKGCVARFGAHEPWREPQHTDSPAFTTGHPRMRGERHLVTRMDPCQDGLSPHVRGTPLRFPIAQAPIRFIPACAGNAVSSIW